MAGHNNFDENGEVDERIPVSDEDRDNVINYCKNFGVTLNDELQKAMDKFVADKTYKNMLDFKLELCKWLVECGHESFADSLWDHPKEAAKDIIFDLQFDKDVQSELDDTLDSKKDKDSN